ncbi:DUF6153 family protein [Streptomyces sp. NPDC046821]|uniref:DUF6153 family protein n=1 Tax=Streptomyces sp. NPDC046821 TaxID=3154702 RepID=UPI0033C7544C
MTPRPVRPPRPRPTPRLLGLLVGAVLLGLLGMHGLGSIPMGTRGEGYSASAPPMRMGTATGHHVAPEVAPQHASRASAPEKCDHENGGGCDGYMAHADSVCASASVAGPPTLVDPALTPDVSACPAQPQGRVSSAVGEPDGGRAPPSLSELQLLRI